MVRTPRTTMILAILEVVAFVVMAVLAVLWVRDPGGIYEPWTVLCGVVGAGIELIRRFLHWFDSRRTRIPPATGSRAADLIAFIHQHGTEKPLSQLLPRALELSRLLGDRGFEHWVRMESYGYDKEGGMTAADTVPPYREITGTYIDEYGRMLRVTSPKLSFINTHRFRCGVGTLEEFAKKTDMINIRDDHMNHLLRKEFNVEVVRFCFNPVAVVSVLDNIRNRLLERITQLETGTGRASMTDQTRIKTEQGNLR